MLTQIENRKQFEKLKQQHQDFLILAFYTDNSRKSLQALGALEKAKKANPDMPIYAVNAGKVKEIHPLFGVDSVPTVVLLKGGRVAKVVDGVQKPQVYEMLLQELPQAPGKAKNQRRHKVVVYTSPHCPWCTRVKKHLREHGVAFREVDVARNERIARELVRRSGKMGTPQTDIDGRIVVGFDQQRIDALLGIAKI